MAILKSLDNSGAAPKSRLGDAYDAEQLASQLIQRYSIRGKVDAQVQGMVDGNKPVNQALLDSEGLGFAANINWRLLEGDVNSAQNPFYLLFADVPNYICVKVNPPDYMPSEWKKMGSIIEEELTILLDEWDQFDYRMQLAIRNKTIFGMGPLYFCNKEDFRFEAAPRGTVFVDDEVTQDMSKLNMLFLYYEWGLPELFDAIEAEGAEEYWDAEAVKELLTNSCNSYARAAGYNRARNWVYWQNKLRDHDTWFSTVDAKVRTCWAYIREFGRGPKKITRALITADSGTSNGKYLYRKDREFDEWGQIIHPMFSEIGNGHWNGTKGLGIKAANARDAQNRLKNRLLDAAMIGSQIILQAKDEKALDAFQIGQMGPYSVINQELTPVQTPLASVLDKPMAVDRMLEYDLRGNIGSLRQKMGDPQSVQPLSAEQAGIQASYEDQLSLGDETMWLRQLDKVYQEMCKRIFIKPRAPSESYPHEEWEIMVADFHKRCKDRGVPDSAFRHVRSVKAYRSVGRGSEYRKQQTAGQVYQILSADPNVPEETRVDSLRDLIAALTGREALENIWPSESITLSPTNDASKAQDENAGMLMGVEPIWTRDQNNLSQATTHIQFGVQRLQMTQQGQMDPGQYLQFAQVAIPHAEFTVSKIPGDRKKGTAYQAMFNAVQQWTAETRQIAQQYQAQQEAQAAQQQEQQAMMQQAQQTGQLLDPESQLEMARIKSDYDLGVMKIQSDDARKNAKLSQQLNTNAAKTTQGMAIKDTVTAQDLTIKNAKARNEIQINTAKAKSSQTKQA